MRPGPLNALTDVAGLRVGHAQVEGGLSGTTVVLAPADGAVAGVDVRGAAPGTRETDLLRPDTTVQRVHAIVLSGGSAYGLAAADGVMARLEAAGVGFPVPGGVVPIVPAAVVFDLGRGGAFGARPTAATGAAAFDAATEGPVAQGVVGAGTGAVVGGSQGRDRDGERGARRRRDGRSAGRAQRRRLGARPRHRPAPRPPGRAGRRVRLRRAGVPRAAARPGAGHGDDACRRRHGRHAGQGRARAGWR